MTTRGDQWLSAPLSEIGGKGLFIKELESAIAEGRADVAVHSIKDVPAELPAGFVLPVIGYRSEVRDVLVRSRSASVAGYRAARVGSSSLRRQRNCWRADRPGGRTGARQRRIPDSTNSMPVNRRAAGGYGPAASRTRGSHSRIPEPRRESAGRGPGRARRGVQRRPSRRDRIAAPAERPGSGALCRRRTRGEPSSRRRLFVADRRVRSGHGRRIADARTDRERLGAALIVPCPATIGRSAQRRGNASSGRTDPRRCPVPMVSIADTGAAVLVAIGAGRVGTRRRVASERLFRASCRYSDLAARTRRIERRHAGFGHSTRNLRFESRRSFRARPDRCAVDATPRTEVDRGRRCDGAYARRTWHSGAATGDRVVGGYTGARAAQSSSPETRVDLCGSRWTAATSRRTDETRRASQVVGAVRTDSCG